MKLINKAKRKKKHTKSFFHENWIKINTNNNVGTVKASESTRLLAACGSRLCFQPQKSQVSDSEENREKIVRGFFVFLLLSLRCLLRNSGSESNYFQQFS